MRHGLSGFGLLTAKQKRYAIGIDSGDAPVILADAERSMEIPSDGGEVADGVIVGFVVPCTDGLRGQTLQHLAPVERVEIRRGIAIAP